MKPPDHLTCSSRAIAGLIEQCAKLVEVAPIYHGQTGYTAIKRRDKRIAETIRALVPKDTSGPPDHRENGQ